MITLEQEQELRSRKENGTLSTEATQHFDTLEKNGQLPSQIAQQQQQEKVIQEQPKPKDNYSTAGGVAQEVANTALGGFEPQVEGGIGALGEKIGDIATGRKNAPSIGEEYKSHTTQAKRDLNRFESEHQLAALGAGVGGAFLPTGELGLAAKAGNYLGKGAELAGSKLGESFGKLAGGFTEQATKHAVPGAIGSSSYAQGEALKNQAINPESRDANIGTAAEAGALTGLASPILGRLAGVPLRKALRLIQDKLGTDEAGAMRKYADTFANNKEKSDVILNHATKRHSIPEYTLLDIPQIHQDYLDHIAPDVTSKLNSEQIENHANRSGQRNERLLKDIHDQTIDINGKSYDDLNKEEKELQSRITKPLYEKAYDKAHTFKITPTLADDLENENNTKLIKDRTISRDFAEGEAKKKAIINGEEYDDRYAGTYMRKLHNLASDKSEEAFNAYDNDNLSPTEKQTAKTHGEGGSRIRQEIGAQIPEFAQANELWANHMRAREILKNKKNIFDQDPLDISRVMVTGSEPEKEAIRKKYAKDMTDIINKARTSGVDHLIAIDSPNFKKISIAVAKEPEKLFNRLDAEKEMKKTDDMVLKSISPEKKGENLPSVHSTKSNIIISALKSAGKAISGGNDNKFANKVVEILEEKDKDKQVDSIEKLKEAIASKEKSKKKTESFLKQSAAKGSRTLAGKFVG